MTDFDDIRPYNDLELPGVLARLASDKEFIDTILSIKYPGLLKWLPWLMRPVMASILHRKFIKINTVDQLQDEIGVHMTEMFEKLNTEVTVSGLENLSAGVPYLFISNHRDIAMDPAFVNYVLYHNGLGTLRIAIGDNLLSKPFAADLMRLNKSFVVKRSLSGRREKLDALVQLSRYIRFSLLEDKHSVWIAQREGRAKDGLDKTEKALLKMLALSKPKEQSFTEAIAALQLVPVAISYEYDPLDAAKAMELHSVENTGGYEKQEHEDLSSIYKGIVGDKGRVHIAFGKPITSGFDTDEELTNAIDQQIIDQYLLHPSNVLAYEKLYGDSPELSLLRNEIESNWALKHHEFDMRLKNIPEQYRKILLSIYANPVSSKLKLNNP